MRPTREPRRLRSRTAEARMNVGARSLLEQDLQIVRVVLSTVPIGHQCAQTTTAVDQKRVGRVREDIARSNSFPLGVDAIEPAHGGELLCGAGPADKSSIEG